MTLILNGTTGVADVDGSASTPAIRGTDTNTGIFFPAADTIAFAEGGAEVARFDSSGRFTVPNQPAFLAGSTLGDTTYTSGSVIPFDLVSFNTGGNFSTGTGRFTAPVAGRYQFNFLAYFTSSGGNTQSMQISPYLNGSQITYGSDAILFAGATPNTTSVICIGGSVVLDLAANDYVTANARGSSARLYMGHTKFSGYLIG